MSATPEQAPLSEQQVADYLYRHPDFFYRHEQLLEQLQVPHTRSGKAVSLIERQVELIREQKHDLKQQLHQLTVAARDNELLLQRFQALILRLIGSDSIEQATRYIQAALCEDFAADAVELILFKPHPQEGSEDSDDPALRPFARILQGRRPVCGHFSDAQLQLLFGAQPAPIASAVVVPLCDDPSQSCIGLLGIGSHDAKRYHPEMGTVFLGHLGAVMNTLFRAHLER